MCVSSKTLVFGNTSAEHELLTMCASGSEFEVHGIVYATGARPTILAARFTV